MNKNKIIIIVGMILIAVVTAVIVCLNYDRINSYIENRSWEIVDSIATIPVSEYVSVTGGSKLMLLTSDAIRMYSDTSKAVYETEVSSNSFLTDSEREFYVVANGTDNKIFLLKDDVKVWELTVKGNVLNVSVNKNGYVAITYSQSGYKSLVKVINPNGEELFTNFLATTYVVDAEISNDNKILAIAEVDAEGILVKSNVKLIHIDKIEDQAVNMISMANNELVIDIEFNDNNQILILKDKGVDLLTDEKELVNVASYTYSAVPYATIVGKNQVVLVKKTATGIFDSTCSVQIIKDDELHEYELNSIPQHIYVMNKTIALDLGSQVIFINTNGKLMKKCNTNGQVKEIVLYDNGNMAALILRDGIEIIKI